MKKYTFNGPWDIVKIVAMLVGMAAVVVGWLAVTTVALTGALCVMAPWLACTRLVNAINVRRYCREQG